MRILPTLLFLILISNLAIGQQEFTPVYKRFPDVPPLKLISVPDSLRFVKNDLPKNTPVLIMVFSPDCDHCQEATRDMIKHMNLFKKVKILMTSPLDYAHLFKFYNDYKLSQYANVLVARDPSYFLGAYYGIKNFPSLYLYDKNQQFVKEFENHVSFNEIATYLKTQ